MSQVWTRDDWNSLIDRINSLCSNPPTGCTAVGTLPDVGPNHIWTKTDIQSVQNKLTAICSNNTFTEPLKLWKQSVINAINTALDIGWCNCKCPNANGVVITYVGTVTQSGCVQIPISQACPGTCQASAVAYGQAAENAMQQWSAAYLIYCANKANVAVIQAELSAAQAALPALQARQDAACSTTPPNPSACAAATAAVTNQQTTITNLQNSLSAANAILNTSQTTANNFASTADAQATLSMNEVTACSVAGQVLSLSSLVLNTPLPFNCGTTNPLLCRVFWNISTRLTIHSTFGDSVGPWQSQLYGWYTSTGKPYVLGMPGCGGVTHYACSSTDCSAVGADTCLDTTNTVEIRLSQTFPSP